MFRKNKVQPANEVPFTPGMRKVFEEDLIHALAPAKDASIVILLLLMDRPDLNGTQMICQLSKKEPSSLRDSLIHLSEESPPACPTATRQLQAREFLWKAKEQALLCGHTWVGTEHLVLALIADKKYEASAELARLQVSYPAAKLWLTNFLVTYNNRARY